MSSLGGLVLTPYFQDNFDSGVPNPGWAAAQGASLNPGQSGLGWDLSQGAGGFGLPVIVYDHPNDSQNVWGTRFWWQQQLGVNADFMVWTAMSGDQLFSDTLADGSVRFRMAGGGTIVTSAPGVIVANTWQFHDVRFRRGPGFWELWWEIDGVVVIDHGPIAGAFNPIFRVIWSVTSVKSWLDEVVISFEEIDPWLIGMVG